MRSDWKLLVACLSMITLLAASGCGGGTEDPPDPTVAIEGQDSGQGEPIAEPTEEAPEDPAPDLLHPTVVLETSMGSITLRLDKEKAPQTVDNFLWYVDQGHYDRTIFHQVIRDRPQVIVGGAFTTDRIEKKAGSPYGEIYCEARQALSNRRGTIAMARRVDHQHSATCYFFINVSDNQEQYDYKELDYERMTPEAWGYCAFGEVIEGMEVVEKIAAAEVKNIPQFDRIPVETVMIERARRQVR